MNDRETKSRENESRALQRRSHELAILNDVARALNAKSDGVFFRAQSAALQQPVFQAPSVFNFYPPDYVVPGTDVLGPEFALQNTTRTTASVS